MLFRSPIATTLHLAGAWNPDAEQTAKIEAGETTIDEIGPGIGSVVAARDGSLWVSVAEDMLQLLPECREHGNSICGTS